MKELDKNLCAQEDRITKLTEVDHQRGHSYIPYPNNAIGWHTDGYFNPLHQRVLALVLHCEHSSETGGVSDLLDPDMVYIHLRDQNTEFIKALSSPGVMCIPEILRKVLKYDLKPVLQFLRRNLLLSMTLY